MWEQEIQKFVSYMKDVLKKQEHTLEAYKRDVRKFKAFLDGRGVDYLSCDNSHMAAFVMEQTKEGRSKATVNRRISSIRLFFQYLVDTGQRKDNPTKGIKTVRLERKTIDYLTIEEVTALIEAPDTTTLKGVRDRAILETMYGTGLRVTEIIDLNLANLNLRMGMITCNGEGGRARVVPLGAMARMAMSDYMMECRPKLVSEEKGDKSKVPLFVNMSGERISRQGLWKILKAYGNKVGLADRISPIILRNSFAVHLIQNGADAYTLQTLLGHEDLKALQVYLDLKKNKIKEVYDKTHPRA